MSRIANIDRRIIYLLLIAVISLALLRPIGLAIKVSPETMKVYNAIDQIPPGSVVWMGFDFDAGAIPDGGRRHVADVGRRRYASF